MKKFYTLIIALFVFASTNAQSGLLAGTGYAPNFTVTDINGTSHTIYDYLDSGYVMVLELMSVTCGHCQSHAAGTENSYLTNGPSGNNVARFLGLEVNASTNNVAVANFAITFGVTFPIANNVSPVAINYQLYYTPGYYIIYPDYTYTTICGAYCVTTQNYLTVENLLNTAIASWVPPIYGCTDSLAVNYNSTATIDNDSCDYTSYTITTVGMSFMPDTIICDVGDTINFILGGYHNAIEVSDSTWLVGDTTSNGGFSFGYGATGIFIPDQCHTYYYVCQPHASMGMKGVIIANHIPVYGCTNPIACNYDSLAIIDDSSCIFQENPIIDMSTYNYTLSFQWGCSGLVYNSEIEFDSSGYAVINPGTFGATNVDWSLCDSFLTWVYTDGTQYTSDTYDNGTFTGTMLSGSGSSTGCFTLTPIIPGCLDSTSPLYNPQANIDDGSCCEHYLRLNMYSSWSGGWSGGIYWTMIDNNGDTVISTALTYNSSTFAYHDEDYICIPDGCYTIVCSNGGGSGGISWTLKDDSTNATILSGGCPFGPYVAGIGTFCTVMGCTDPLAINFNANANVDDGSCMYFCGPITGLFMSDIIHDRVTFNFDNMNTSNCIVDQLRIKYSGDGGTTWSQKNMGSPTGFNNGVCNSTQRTDKIATGLSPSTTYQWQMRVWYCSTGATAWVNGPNFTTEDLCPNVINFTATPVNNVKVNFNWDTTASYSFVRIKLRVDTTNATWLSAGGFGVNYPILSKQKGGLSPGQTYRGQARTWCNPSGGAYRATTWTPLVWWTQPASIKIEGENTAITNLDVYPNPSRDIFNIIFTANKKQDLEIRIVNVIGENIFIESKQQFVGEYTKQINLKDYPKAIYFLEIETDDRVINKKLILQ